MILLDRSLGHFGRHAVVSCSVRIGSSPNQRTREATARGLWHWWDMARVLSSHTQRAFCLFAWVLQGSLQMLFLHACCCVLLNVWMGANVCRQRPTPPLLETPQQLEAGRQLLCAGFKTLNLGDMWYVSQMALSRMVFCSLPSPKG